MSNFLLGVVQRGAGLTPAVAAPPAPPRAMWPGMPVGAEGEFGLEETGTEEFAPAPPAAPSLTPLPAPPASPAAPSLTPLSAPPASPGIVSSAETPARSAGPPGQEFPVTAREGEATGATFVAAAITPPTESVTPPVPRVTPPPLQAEPGALRPPSEAVAGEASRPPAVTPANEAGAAVPMPAREADIAAPLLPAAVPTALQPALRPAAFSAGGTEMAAPEAVVMPPAPVTLRPAERWANTMPPTRFAPAEARAEPEPAPPRLEVRIGRVEIKLNRPPTPPAAPAPPKSGFEAYARARRYLDRTWY